MNMTLQSEWNLDLRFLQRMRRQQKYKFGILQDRIPSSQQRDPIIKDPLGFCLFLTSQTRNHSTMYQSGIMKSMIQLPRIAKQSWQAIKLIWNPIVKYRPFKRRHLLINTKCNTLKLQLKPIIILTNCLRIQPWKLLIKSKRNKLSSLQKIVALNQVITINNKIQKQEDDCKC